MISISEAIDVVLSAVPARPAEDVPLAAALGRTLAGDVRAGFAIPPFDNSQMDGFAVRSSDLAAAGPDRPGRLRVVGTVAAGSAGGPEVVAGSAVRIMTGAPLPPGADAVVRVEDTATEGELVSIRVAPRPREFVRPAGEDVAAGELVLERGRNLRPADLGLLAAMGRPTVRVATRPRVAILATGDELVPVGEPLAPGKIHDSNAYSLSGSTIEAGGEPVVMGIVPDDPDSLRRAFHAAAHFDFVLSTGGVSVGDFDHVKRIMDEVGLVRRFWKVAQKPGKPLTFAERHGTLFFGLPGNPVSALVCFALYVAPAVRRSLGRVAVFPPTARVRMAEGLRTARDLTELVRCVLEPSSEGGWIARPTGTQSSGVLRSLSLADALVVSPPGVAELARGESYAALLLASPPFGEGHPFD